MDLDESDDLDDSVDLDFDGLDRVADSGKLGGIVDVDLEMVVVVHHNCLFLLFDLAMVHRAFKRN